MAGLEIDNGEDDGNYEGNFGKKGHSNFRIKKMPDTLCCIVFTVFLISMIVVCVIATGSGNALRLVAPTDYAGNLCGYELADAASAAQIKGTNKPSGQITKYKNVFYPRLEKDILESGITSTAALTSEALSKINLFGVCVESCPKYETVSVGGYNQLLMNSDTMMYVCKYHEQETLDNMTVFAGAKNNWTSACSKNADGTFTSTECRDARRARNIFLNKCVSASYSISAYMDVTTNPPAERACKDEANNLDFINHCWLVPTTYGNPVFGYCFPSSVPKSVIKTCAQPTNVAWNSTQCQAVTVRESQEVIKTPSEAANGGENPLYVMFGSYADTLKRMLGDLYTVRMYLGIFATAVPFCIAAIITILVGFFVNCVVYSSIILGLLMQLVAAVYLLYKGNVISSTQIASVIGSEYVNAAEAQLPTYVTSTPADETQQYAIAGFIVLAIFALCFCLIIASRKSISIAVTVIKEGSKCVTAHSSMQLLPLFSGTMIVMLALYWVIVAMYIYTMRGDPLAATNAALSAAAQLSGVNSSDSTAVAYLNNFTGGNSSIVKYQASQLMEPMLWYHVFGGLWILNVIHYFGVCVLADSTIQYLSGAENLPRGVVFYSMGKTFCYHMGSVAMGAFILAAVNFVRVVFYVMTYSYTSGQSKNLLLKAVICIVDYCIRCIEKCIQYCSEKAFMLCMLQDMGFCGAAVETFMLIMSAENLWVFMLCGFVVKVVLFLAKLLCTVTSAFAFYYLLDTTAAYQRTGETPDRKSVV